MNVPDVWGFLRKQSTNHDTYLHDKGEINTNMPSWINKERRWKQQEHLFESWETWMYRWKRLLGINEKRFQSRIIFSWHLQCAGSANSSGKYKLCCKICSSFLFYLTFLKKGTSRTFLAGWISLSVTVFKQPFPETNAIPLNRSEQDTGVLKAKYQSWAVI